MFRLEVIFFIAVVSFVNAAITVNIFDDGDKDVTDIEEDFQDARGCYNKFCDQLCRILNFPGGMCVNGSCKCNNMKQADDVEEPINLESKLQEAHSCNNQACDQLCRRLKFSGGICVNGRCKCDYFKQPDLILENVKSLGSCNWRACDQLCRRLGFPGGVCVGDNCKCDNFRLNNNEDLLEVNDVSVNEKKNTNQCNNGDCENYCRKLGLPGGYCYQDQCICYKKIEKEEASSLQRCDVVACNEICHRLNYIGGMCRDGSCYCY